MIIRMIETKNFEALTREPIGSGVHFWPGHLDVAFVYSAPGKFVRRSKSALQTEAILPIADNSEVNLPIAFVVELLCSVDRRRIRVLCEPDRLTYSSSG